MSIISLHSSAIDILLIASWSRRAAGSFSFGLVSEFSGITDNRTPNTPEVSIWAAGRYQNEATKSKRAMPNPQESPVPDDHFAGLQLAG
jgi:hypothetical protein